MKKEKFVKAYEDIGEVEDLLTEADSSFDRLPIDIKNAILNYHNDLATIQYCLRWGLQAVKEIREDWHTVVADIHCGE